MTENSIVDVPSLLQDLRLAVAYAARVGALRDETLKIAERGMSDDSNPDVHALTLALNHVTQAIAPMTLADLKFGRDPFLAENQKRARRLQLSLTIFSLIVLTLIGYFMHSLGREQSAISTLKEIESLRPIEKLTSLRKLAQFENPMVTPSTLYDQYHEKLGELSRIKDRIQNSYMQALEAVNIPLFPFGDHLAKWRAATFGSTAMPVEANKGAPAAVAKSEKKVERNEGTATPASFTSSGMSAVQGGVAGANSLETPPIVLTKTIPSELCKEDSHGRISLSTESQLYPEWMRRILLDTQSDFCFQLKVLSPTGDLLAQSFSSYYFISSLKEKVSLRVEWFLPFLYGLLGSAVFMMRNIANIRTPAMEWFPILMRVSLGGVAGIVIGWFSAATTSSPGATASFLPFGLAFLTGYGIEVLFTLLDRLNRAIGEAAPGRSGA
jgi:hypothetical protein